MRSSRPNWTKILAQRGQGFANPESETLNLEPDARSQKGQNTLIGAITAMTKAADLALGKYSQDKELITLMTDAVAMALQYNHEVHHSQRLALKKEMHKDYAALPVHC